MPCRGARAILPQENAPGDAPYWRGSVWMPVNFLALRALSHYAKHPTASRELQGLANETYAQLRANLLATVLGGWENPSRGKEGQGEGGTEGSLWEHYDDKTGRGLRSHPFTGWTALILNIMAEQYSI